MQTQHQKTTPQTLQPLQGVRILSLALNLPGPAALMRCRRMGAKCVKLEPPNGDPMANYNQLAYAKLHEGIGVLTVDLKSEAGQQALHEELAKSDVLLTSFRPSALVKLGIDWATLQSIYPALSQIAIVGSAGERAEAPGHDLTYQADCDLVPTLDLPPTLYADMGGSVMASEAVLQATMARDANGKGVLIEIALAEAAAYLALPREWGLSQTAGPVGGAHAGYRVYPCKDGRVAVAALEPHFAAALCAAAGLIESDWLAMQSPATHSVIAGFLLAQTQEELDLLSASKDIPLHTMS